MAVLANSHGLGGSAIMGPRSPFTSIHQSSSELILLGVTWAHQGPPGPIRIHRGPKAHRGLSSSVAQ